MLNWTETLVIIAAAVAYGALCWRLGYMSGLKAESRAQEARQRILRRLHEGTSWSK